MFHWVFGYLFFDRQFDGCKLKLISWLMEKKQQMNFWHCAATYGIPTVMTGVTSELEGTNSYMLAATSVTRSTTNCLSSRGTSCSRRKKTWQHDIIVDVHRARGLVTPVAATAAAAVAATDAAIATAAAVTTTAITAISAAAAAAAAAGTVTVAAWMTTVRPTLLLIVLFSAAGP
jgi:hypothetical protein